MSNGSFFYKINPKIRTVIQERIATVKSERLQIDAIIAIIVPISAVQKFPVEYRTKGKVIADKTAKGI